MKYNREFTEDGAAIYDPPNPRRDDHGFYRRILFLAICLTGIFLGALYIVKHPDHQAPATAVHTETIHAHE